MSHFLGFTVRKRNDIFVKIANNSFFKRIAKTPEITVICRFTVISGIHF